MSRIQISGIAFWIIAIGFWGFLSVVVATQLVGWLSLGLLNKGYASGWLTSLISISVVAIIAAAIKYLPRLSLKYIHYLYIFLAVLVIVTELVVVHALASYGHAWDVGTVDIIARHYAINGTTAMPGTWEDTYLAKYDNNIPITLFLSLVYTGAGYLFGPNYGIYSQLINIFAILGSVFMLVFVAWKLYGHRAALLAFAAGYILILLSPYVAITYTDTLGMLFVAAVVFCAVMLSREKSTARITWSILFGAVIYCGYLVKPTVIFIGGAIITMAIIKYLTNKPSLLGLKQWRGVIISVPVGLVVGFAGYQATLHVTPNFAHYTAAQIDANKTPLGHFLAMGGFTGIEPYPKCDSGSFCMKFVAYMQSGDDAVSTIDEREAYALKLWKDNVEHNFPFGYGVLLIKKTLFNYSDGSFGVWKEGAASNDKIIFYNDTSLDRFIRSALGPFGANKDGFKAFMQAIWLAVLLVISLGVVLAWRSRKFREDYWQNCFRVAILGVTFFLMVFEARPRYLFLYLPIFILLAVGTIQAINSRYRQASVRRPGL